jgi:transcriptional regulator with XRE-family HTH domain
MGFKENLKTELVYSGMLVKELAAKSGVKKHTIDNYLSNHERMPAADVAVRLARALGVSVEYLVTGTEGPSTQNMPQFSPEARLLARYAEDLDLEYRKIALTLVQSLKNHQAQQRSSTAKKES